MRINTDTCKVMRASKRMALVKILVRRVELKLSKVFKKLK